MNMNIRSLVVALVAIMLFACNDSTVNPNSDELLSDVVSSSSDEPSSSSVEPMPTKALGTIDIEVPNEVAQNANTKDTLLLTNLGTLRVSINDGTKGVPSTKSTVSVSGGAGSSLKIDFVADDAGVDGVEWGGGHTMVLVEYTLSDPLPLSHIDGMRIESVYMDSVRHYDTLSFTVPIFDVNTGKTVDTLIQHISDGSTRPDPNYFGFIFTSVTGAIHDTRCDEDVISAKDISKYHSYDLSYLTDSDNDGWMADVSEEYRGGFCMDDGCDLTKVAFYFWTYRGKGSITINGLSLLTK